jgi:2-methylcitrate dehydratase PrpD
VTGVPLARSVADDLAAWACSLEPGAADLELAQRSLRDTVAVTLAARDHRVTSLAGGLSEGGRWAVAGHVLDFDDLHMESTSHVSVVCVPAVLAAGGDARSYLAAAGVMARLGNALGWKHYSAGWHATCTAGALAAAAGAAVSFGLGAEQVATALALAVPGAGGVQRAFGTDAKSLQVGFAVETGLRAARLAADGAGADVTAVDAWLEMVGGSRAWPGGGPAVPGGLAIKIYPCCYALQRPISALSELKKAHSLDPADVEQIRLRTPKATLAPLIHHRPRTGLQAKFSIEYAAATALLDDHQGFEAFTDDAAIRPQARALLEKVTVEAVPGGDWLLAGELEVEVQTRTGAVLTTAQQFPPGSPARPPNDAEFGAKLADCLIGVDTDPDDWTWAGAPALLRDLL